MNPTFKTLVDQLHTGYDVEQSLAAIADFLLNGCVLTVGGSAYRLIEIEGYYTHPSGHNDPFTHKAPAQQTAGTWYWHREAGRRNGVDLTIGSREAHGGFLFRSLVEEQTQQQVYGPGNIVGLVLKKLDRSSTADLPTDAFSNSQFALKERTSKGYERVLAVPRHGLGGPVGEDAHWRKKPYRYITSPTLRHDGKEGPILRSLLDQNYSLAEINQLFNRNFKAPV